MTPMFANGLRIYDDRESGRRFVQGLNDGHVTDLSPEGFEAYGPGLYDFEMNRLGDEGPNGELIPAK